MPSRRAAKPFTFSSGVFCGRRGPLRPQNQRFPARPGPSLKISSGGRAIKMEWAYPLVNCEGPPFACTMRQGIARSLETFPKRYSAARHAALPQVPHDVSHDPPEMGTRTGIERNTVGHNLGLRRGCPRSGRGRLGSSWGRIGVLWTPNRPQIAPYLKGRGPIKWKTC